MPGLKLIGEVALDGSGFQRGLNQLGAMAGSLKGQIAQIFSVAAIEEFVRRTLEGAAAIKSYAEQMGISTEAVQRFQIAAHESNLEFENIATGLIKIGKARKAAAEHDDNLLQQFARFGITMQDLQNPMLQNIDLIKQIGAALEHMDLTAADRTALDELMGRVGEKLGIVLKEAEKVNAVQIISDDNIKRLADSEKTLSRMSGAIKVIGSNLLSNFLSNFNDAYELIKTVIENHSRGMSWEEAARKAKEGFAERAKSGQDDADWEEFMASTGGAPSKGLFHNRRGEGEVVNTPDSSDKFGHGKQIKSDSLIAVGNFLGSGKTVLDSIAGKQLEYTRRIADGIAKLVFYAAKDPGPSGGVFNGESWGNEG